MASEKIPNKFIFVRLYSVTYKPESAILSPLKGAIDLATKRASDNHSYHHAAISDNLKDDFYGLTSGGDGSQVKIEKCDHAPDGFNRYMSSIDGDKSTYAIYALPVTATEYKKASGAMKASLSDGRLKYDVLSMLPLLGKQISGNNTITKNNELDTDYFGNTNIWQKVHIENEAADIFKKHSFVCSTFVAYIIAQCSKRFNEYFNKKHIDTATFAPSDISHIPTIKEIFSGTCNNYNRDAKTFVQQVPLFKEYL